MRPSALTRVFRMWLILASVASSRRSAANFFVDRSRLTMGSHDNVERYFFFPAVGFAAAFGPFLAKGTPRTRESLLSTCGFGIAFPDSYS